MDIKQLHYFYTIVQEGTISKAAKSLHLTQPPLSIQIKLLEEEIGSPLFIRGPRAIQLTETGKLLYTRAQTILSLLDTTAKELEDQKQGNGGTLKIGVVSSVNDQLLRDWIVPFSRQYPNIRYEITESNTYELIDQLSHHLIEIAVVRTPFPSSDALKIKEWKEEPFYLAGTCDPPATLKQLAEQPLIIYRRWKQIFDEYFQAHDLVPNYFCINDDARTSIQWAKENLGLALLPESSLKGANIPCVKLDFNIFSKICILTHKNQYVSTPAQLFLKTFV